LKLSDQRSASHARHTQQKATKTTRIDTWAPLKAGSRGIANSMV
jgi:hypothetical protein